MNATYSSGVQLFVRDQAGAPVVRETASWQGRRRWQCAVLAVVPYIRAAAGRARVPVRDCQELRVCEVVIRKAGTVALAGKDH